MSGCCEILLDADVAERVRRQGSTGKGPFDLRSVRTRFEAGGQEVTLVKLGPLRALQFPAEGRPAATLVHLHGGGFVAGGVRGASPFCKLLAGDLGISVYSVKYGLAPDVPLPETIRDIAMVIERCRAETPSSTPLWIAGESAGCALAIEALKFSRARIDMILLLNPALHELSDSEETRRLVPVNSISPEFISWCWSRSGASAYLERNVSGYAAAINEYSGIHPPPPVVVLTAQYDLFRDQAWDLHGALLERGLNSQVFSIPGQNHSIVRHAESLLSSYCRLRAAVNCVEGGRSQ